MDYQAKPLTFMAKVMSPIGKLMTGIMRKCVDQDLEDLKRLAEQRAGGATVADAEAAAG